MSIGEETARLLPYGVLHGIRLGMLRERLEAGDTDALVEALQQVAGSALAVADAGDIGLPMPPWLAERVYAATKGWLDREAASLDAALKIRQPKAGYNTPKKRQLRRLAGRIFDDVSILHQRGGFKIEKDLYACVGARHSDPKIKIGPKDVAQVYESAMSAMREYVPAGKDGSAEYARPEMFGVLDRYRETLPDTVPVDLAAHVRKWEASNIELAKLKR
jgi:hypothetical protein